jgi:hypothetical protein
MTKLLKLAGASALLYLAFAIPAPAQISNSVNFTAPFPFYAGNTKLPAGSYKVTQATFDSSVLMIESTNGGHSAFVEFTPTQADAGHKATDVGFKKYGTTEVLNTVWVAGQQFGMQVEITKFEQSLAKSGAPATHSVAAKGQ